MFCNLHIIESNPELDASSVESVQKLLHHLCLGGGQQTTGAQGGAGSLGGGGLREQLNFMYF